MDHLIHHPMVLILLVLSLLCGCVVCKDCDNVFPAMASHTFRYELLKSNNETLKKEVFSHYPHVTPTDESSWMSLLPRKMLKEEEEFDWIMTYRKIKNPAAGFPGNAGFLKEVPLEDVKLDSGSLHWRGQQTNLEYLMMLDNDNLLWSFRNTAGLPTPGQPYGGWEAPTIELRGHFVGHYLSATARMWASTYNQTLKDKMTALVANLAICQKQIGNGYLSAFPTELFDRVEALQLVWAPYYTIHKIMQGLLDQYTIARNEQAFEMVKWMVDYFYNRVQNVIIKYSIERHWALQNEETGGMNDLLYQLYTLTGDQRHLLLAHLFDKPCFLGVLAIQAEELSGFHANTHIAIVIGAQMRYEVIGDPLYKEMGTFFLNSVNSSHTYATGGTSEHEFWEDPKRLATTLTAENEESCSTYNMLKVSRHLFRWTKEMAYADYYERALTNGVLSIQRGTDPGIMIYMLPLQPGGSKAISIHGWGTKFDTFWCCYGTGIESFSKLGDSIYFEEQGTDPGLYIIQYISSSFKWKTGGILLHQRADHVVSWDRRLTITVWITPLQAEAMESTLNFRIPFWAVGDGLKVSLNDQSICGPKPGSFLPIRHKWTSGDNITMELPLSLRIEAIQDDRPEYSSIHAILYGPYLLAGFSIGDWDIQTDQGASLVDSITSIPEEYNNNLKTFSQESGQSSFVLTLNNGTINMETLPQTGTNLAAGATFRLISTTKNVSSCEEVMLEPYNFPGLALMHQGKDQPLAVASASDTGDSSVFKVVPGLDGCKDTVSLESANQKDCYVYSYIRDEKYPGASIKLGCIATMSNDEFNKAVSFKLEDGMGKYDPISFVMKGKNRNFLLSPLLSMRDESYAVYFNMTQSL